MKFSIVILFVLIAIAAAQHYGGSRSSGHVSGGSRSSGHLSGGSRSSGHVSGGQISSGHGHRMGRSPQHRSGGLSGGISRGHSSGGLSGGISRGHSSGGISRGHSSGGMGSIGHRVGRSPQHYGGSVSSGHMGSLSGSRLVSGIRGGIVSQHGGVSRLHG